VGIRLEGYTTMQRPEAAASAPSGAALVRGDFALFVGVGAPAFPLGQSSSPAIFTDDYCNVAFKSAMLFVMSSPPNAPCTSLRSTASAALTAASAAAARTSAAA
jgi:hypothetical protein